MTRRAASWLFFAALSAPFWALGHPLIEVDDARYAEVPREMVQSGDWATPTLDGMDYVEKPPLGYWLTAAAYKVFGINEATARLPLALLALAALLGTAWMGEILYDVQTGRRAAMALSSSALFFFLSHYITPDLPLTTALVFCMACVLECARRPSPRWAVGAWACAGLAVLAKGLVGLLFPVGWSIGLAFIAPKWRRGLLRLLDPAGIAVFAGIAAPWFVLMERRHPGFLRFFFGEQHFQRFLTSKYNRGNPWWFFLVVTPAAFLPWTIPAARGALAVRAWREDPRAAALLGWIAMVVAFFSLSHSKLATYVLPAFPAGSLLAASAWPRRGGTFATVGLSLGLLCLGVFELGTERISVEPLCRQISSRIEPTDEIWAYGIYLHGVPFYLRRQVDRVVQWTGELQYARRDPANAGRFGDDSAVATLPLKGRRVFLVYRAFERPHLFELLRGKAILAEGGSGPWAFLEL